MYVRCFSYIDSLVGLEVRVRYQNYWQEILINPFQIKVM